MEVGLTGTMEPRLSVAQEGSMRGQGKHAPGRETLVGRDMTSES